MTDQWSSGLPLPLENHNFTKKSHLSDDHTLLQKYCKYLIFTFYKKETKSLLITGLHDMITFKRTLFFLNLFVFMSVQLQHNCKCTISTPVWSHYPHLIWVQLISCRLNCLQKAVMGQNNIALNNQWTQYKNKTSDSYQWHSVGFWHPRHNWRPFS